MGSVLLPVVCCLLCVAACCVLSAVLLRAGSTIGRATESEVVAEGAALKDLDLITNNHRFPIGMHPFSPPLMSDVLQFKGLKRALKADVAFLERHDIIDYSLLIGATAKTDPIATVAHSTWRQVGVASSPGACGRASPGIQQRSPITSCRRP